MTNREGASGSFEWNLERDADALNMAACMLHGLTYVRDITVHRLLTLNNYDPNLFIATIDRDDL